METIKSVLGTAAAIFIALAVWFAFQAFVRRRSGGRCDRDVLEFMTHGCAGCKGDGACHGKKAEQLHQ
jgi:hypothetical protein